MMDIYMKTTYFETRAELCAKQYRLVHKLHDGAAPWWSSWSRAEKTGTERCQTPHSYDGLSSRNKFVLQFFLTKSVIYLWYWNILRFHVTSCGTSMVFLGNRRDYRGC